jgi:type I restriction enzyme M protein
MATIKYQPDKGSLLYKFNIKKELVPLDPKLHKNGNWDNWADETKLMKFDVVLTNPPFGENRKFEPKNESDKSLAECYELWGEARVGNWIDPGLLFLENAYHILGTHGRLGIVLSNSLASIDRWEAARKWLVRKMRVVGLFDLPPNIFAETGVNTTLIVAYKPTEQELSKFKDDGYEVFVKDIQRIGYEVRTLNRVRFFNPIYQIDEKTFQIVINEQSEPQLDEQFTDTIAKFREWANSQEETMKKLFLK